MTELKTPDTDTLDWAKSMFMSAYEADSPHISVNRERLIRILGRYTLLVRANEIGYK